MHRKYTRALTFENVCYALQYRSAARNSRVNLRWKKEWHHSPDQVRHTHKLSFATQTPTPVIGLPGTLLYKCIRICIRVCIRICVHAHAYAYAYTYMHIHVRMCICICICIYTYTYKFSYTYTYMYTHAYIHTHTQSYTHTHTCTTCRMHNSRWNDMKRSAAVFVSCIIIFLHACVLSYSHIFMCGTTFGCHILIYSCVERHLYACVLSYSHTFMCGTT